MSKLKGNAFDHVREFHSAFGHPIGDESAPQMIDDDRKRKRVNWMLEEIDEFIDAKELYQQTDALIDLLYFTIGTLVEMGVHPDIPWEIVQEANMNKLGPDGKPIYHADNKIGKPEGWEPPDAKLKKYFEDNEYLNETLIVGGVSIPLFKASNFVPMMLYDILDFYPRWLKLTPMRKKWSVQGYYCEVLKQITEHKRINMSGEKASDFFLSIMSRERLEELFGTESKNVKAYKDLDPEDRY